MRWYSRLQQSEHRISERGTTQLLYTIRRLYALSATITDKSYGVWDSGDSALRQ